jgi:hypothetical protein
LFVLPFPSPIWFDFLKLEHRDFSRFISALRAFKNFPKIPGDPEIVSAGKFLVSNTALGIFDVDLDVS